MKLIDYGYAFFLFLILLAMECVSCGTPGADPSAVRQDSLQAMQHISGPFHGLSPFGQAEPGAVYDPIANALQNRDVAPTKYQEKTLDELLGTSDEAYLVDANLPRDQWRSSVLAHVMPIENTGETLIGNLSEAVLNDPEGVNSFSKNYRTIHLLLTRNPGESKMGSMEVDLSPRMLEKHPMWNKILGDVGQRVRISGWPYFDARHKNWIGEARRGTLWRIAPVTRIELMDSLGHWTDL